MFERFNSFNTTGSTFMGFESASCCASFFAALLLLVDTVLAVSIFVSADIIGGIVGILVSILVCIFILRVLLLVRPADRRPNPSAA